MPNMTQYPVGNGPIIANLDLSSQGADWVDLDSSMFKDMVSGLTVPSGRRLLWLGVQVLSGSCHLKYRARDTATDATTDELLISATWNHDVSTLRDRVYTVSVKKASASDSVLVTATFAAV